MLRPSRRRDNFRNPLTIPHFCYGDADAVTDRFSDYPVFVAAPTAAVEAMRRVLWLAVLNARASFRYCELAAEC